MKIRDKNNKYICIDRCLHTDREIVAYDLIGKWADVNNIGANGRTPLMTLAGQGNGCEYYWCRYHPSTSYFHNLDICNIFLEPLDCTYSCMGPDTLVEIIIERGTNVNAVDREGHTALDFALMASRSEGKL